MGGEGSILGMIISFRNNRELLKNRRKAFNKDWLDELPHKKFPPLQFKSVSATKLDRIKKRIRYERKIEERRRILFMLLLLISAALFVVILYGYFN